MKLSKSSEKLNNIFEKQNELAKNKQEESAVETEQVYFLMNNVKILIFLK